MKQSVRLFSGLFSLALLLGAFLAIIQRQQIYDYFALKNYTPSERVVALANETAMADDTRRVFYINHPELNDKIAFRQNCPATEQSIVLGCYVQRDGIFLLDVTDPRLNGVIQVTAAHEVLHAEYDRLSSKERARVDKMTADFFATLNNDRVKKTIEQYRQKDPSVVPNELHSILATEIQTLSPELESYYSQYFKDRSQVVAHSEKYEQTFVALTDQVEAYDRDLDNLKGTIESNQQEIEGYNSEINAQKARLDSLLNTGRTEEYNAAVPGFNSEVNAYNSLINRTRTLISNYNDIVAKRNEIATTEQELVQAIDSNSVPQPTQ